MILPKITHQKCVLIVDDNEDASNSLAELLNFLGYTASAIHDGRDTVRIVQAMTRDVVLLDLGMPEMSGYQVALELRQLPNMHNLVIVALTGWSDSATKAKVLKSGFNYHLAKTVPIQDIIDIISCQT